MAVHRDRDLKNIPEHEFYDIASAINTELENCIGYLEEIRTSNAALREWGEELTGELEEAATYINELENKIPLQSL